MTYQLLTNSRADCFKRCRKRHFWTYEAVIHREIDAKPLRMGTAYHEALDHIKCGDSLDNAIDVVRINYDRMPPCYDVLEWEIERETVAALVSGYAWRWQDSPLKIIESEKSFQLPLINPATGKPSQIFQRAGKIDGIIELEDSRQAVLEHKLLSEDVGTDSDFWVRMQMDMQVTGYVVAARDMGYPVDTVLSDIARKPTIKPSAVAVCDDLGAKIVLDQYGQRVRTERGQWRQTGDNAKGYTLQTRAMTAEEFAEKLTTDIGERPDFYYQRREIPRLDCDIAEYKAEMWDVQKTLRMAQVNSQWFRTVSFDSCPRCPYLTLCSMKFDPASDVLPEGFVFSTQAHPELE